MRVGLLEHAMSIYANKRILSCRAMERYMNERKIIIIAGPNGAGKTTFAREFLPNDAGCPIFVNADLIAAGLSPFAPESAVLQAGRLMLQELTRHFSTGNSFAFETTLSGRGYLHHIRQWQSAGYRVKLIFLQLNSAEQAIARVAQRVRQGGHNIPEATIRRRFTAGRKNFEQLYAPLVDAWALYDNSGVEPILLKWSEKPLNDQSFETARDSDLRLSPQSLKRAALKAREIAAQTGTAIVITEQGVMRVVHPKTEQVTRSVHESKGAYDDKS